MHVSRVRRSYTVFFDGSVVEIRYQLWMSTVDVYLSFQYQIDMHSGVSEYDIVNKEICTQNKCGRCFAGMILREIAAITDGKSSRFSKHNVIVLYYSST
jgi:hypothetical protein